MGDTDHREGTLRDTYHAALQHDLVAPADDDLVLGVVAKPMYGIETYVDRNVSALAPSEQLLTEFKRRADEIGHDEAVEAVDYVPRYRAHIEASSEAQAWIDRIVDTLASGTDVWLVCYENTDEKYCHRTTLKRLIEARR